MQCVVAEPVVYTREKEMKLVVKEKVSEFYFYWRICFSTSIDGDQGSVRKCLRFLQTSDSLLHVAFFLVPAEAVVLGDRSTEVSVELEYVGVGEHLFRVKIEDSQAVE